MAVIRDLDTLVGALASVVKMPSGEITLERSIFVGIIFSSILYGIDVTLYFQSCRLLLQKQPRTENIKFYIIYSSIMLFFLTITLATNYAFSDLLWIDDRDVPGGPPAYFANNISAWYNTLGTAADVTVNAMADALLLYRCFVFWSDHRWVIGFPALLYLSSVSMSIITTIDSAMPGANIFQGLPASFSTAWLALTVSFNIIVTLMIIGRLLSTYWMVRKTLSPAFTTTYIDVSATLAESALPFSVLGLGYLISQVLGSNVVIALSFIWGTYAGLAPQFIIYRIARGVAWSKDTTFGTVPGMSFAPNPEAEGSAWQSSGTGSVTLAGCSKIGLESSNEENV